MILFKSVENSWYMKKREMRKSKACNHQLLDEKIDLNISKRYQIQLSQQIQQLIDELDYNSNSFNQVIEKNRNLSKLGFERKVDERMKYQIEKTLFNLKLQVADQNIKYLQQQNEQYKIIDWQF
ncbi:unnamed protein product (macronuclear) [Paramecium tetraurelia]|uniref:Uncharacterized protein n=1 Tax=Paramecium tetraurelia TaxID=5888 RepID=A0DGZ6_PARTE|nr:uncharacterized protein GSPATT00002442001 [Paramecium tetraurelia]CAK82313.1 unnamed protein product [Paramecium tetraurelia]|eukprot:XP_001449710.1 hypothetical protein (macronuclear) [Paramecium tetraurelia strain d4-2]